MVFFDLTFTLAKSKTPRKPYTCCHSTIKITVDFCENVLQAVQGVEKQFRIDLNDDCPVDVCMMGVTIDEEGNRDFTLLKMFHTTVGKLGLM